MTTPFDSLKDAPRLLMEVRLRPIQGYRFQPTGFPDLGPARYKAYRNGDTAEMLLVESPQSVANRLEKVCWDTAAEALFPELQGMPYVRVNRPDGSHLTNSILEAHRLNSPYILESADTTVFNKLREEVGVMEVGPVDIRRLAQTVFKYDPNAVLHGVFIEALDVQDAANGGVKNDHVNPKGDTSAGFGNVPFHRTEFTAKELIAYFNLDLAQLRGYRLDAAAEEFLIALALFKINRFLKSGLRLRTACDLEPVDGLKVTRPDSFTLPEETTVTESLKAALEVCIKEGLFANPAVTTVTFAEKPKKNKKEEKEAEEDNE
jgi:CRISPR-associated protein Csb1